MYWRRQHSLRGIGSRCLSARLYPECYREWPAVEAAARATPYSPAAIASAAWCASTFRILPQRSMYAESPLQNNRSDGCRECSWMAVHQVDWRHGLELD